jgi:hypothetical protein
MGVKVSNNAFGTLAAGINTTDTTITVDSGQGTRFPTLGSGEYFFATLVDTSNNLEIVKVTARSTDSMTVIRAQDDTTATAFAIGDRIELRPVAALFEAIQAESAVADADYGDITVSNSGATYTIDNTVVTDAKLANTLDLSSKTVTLPADVDGSSGLIVSSRSFNSGYGSSASTVQTTTAWETISINGTNKDAYAPATNGNIRTYNKRRNDTHLRIRGCFPMYNDTGGSGCGIRVQMCLSNTPATFNAGANYFTVGLLPDGMTHGWGMDGYGGSTTANIPIYYDTAHGGGLAQTSTETANILAYTGNLHFYFEGYRWSTGDTVYWINYQSSYNKNATWVVEEYIA